MVGVRGRLGAGWEGDFEAEDAFVGGVGEFIFVEDVERGEWGAGLMSLGFWDAGCLMLRDLLHII